MKTILITGTSSGIGLEAAVELARRGERVFASMRDLSRSGPLSEAAAGAGVDVEMVQLDVTDPTSVTRAVDDVFAAAGAIDVVVNNAGIVFAGPMEFSTEEQTLSMFETHVFGPLRLIRAVLPAMRERSTGRIVNVSSGASHARMGHRLMGLYTSSKAALSALTEELCKELAPLGIDVVLIDGAAIGNTRMTRQLREDAARAPRTASPYQVVERIQQLQWPSEEVPGSENWTSLSAGALADACTVAEPAFIHPPEFQAWLAPAMGMSDETFLRLSRLDTSPELYDGLPEYWHVSRRVAEEIAAAPA